MDSPNINEPPRNINELQSSPLVKSVQRLVATLSDDDLFSFLKLCNGTGIPIVLEHESVERCESALAKLCAIWSHRAIAARALVGLNEKKRIEIIQHWFNAGDSQLPYKDAKLCLSDFNDDQIREWEADNLFPEEHVFLGKFPQVFPDSAKKCICCGKNYDNWQLIIRAVCNIHSVHKTCEKKDGDCSTCRPYDS